MVTFSPTVTQNPSSHTTEQNATASGKQAGTENEYVRLGKFPSAKQQPDNSSGYEGRSHSSLVFNMYNTVNPTLRWFNKYSKELIISSA